MTRPRGRPVLPAGQKKTAKNVALPQSVWAWIDAQNWPRGIVIEAVVKHFIKTAKLKEKPNDDIPGQGKKL